MLNEKMIAHIREGGIAQGPKKREDRERRLREFGFRTKDRAEYALIASCFNPYLEPSDMIAFRKLLDRFEVDYSLLPKEYCCGDPFFLHAINTGSEADMREARALAAEFFAENLRQVRRLGASKIILYCAGCDMVFDAFKADVPEEILWYPTLFDRIFRSGKLRLQADYYAGCHRNRRAVKATPLDLDAVTRILGRIEGLELNPVRTDLCCMKAEELPSIAAAIRRRTIITPCSGCSMFLRQALKEREGTRVFLLSEVIWAAASSQSLGGPETPA